MSSSSFGHARRKRGIQQPAAPYRPTEVTGSAACADDDDCRPRLVSIACSLGKQAENVENQGFALEIEGLDVARRTVDALPGLRPERQAAGLGRAVEPRREPVARGLDEDLEHVAVAALEAFAERMQRARVARRKAVEQVDPLVAQRKLRPAVKRDGARDAAIG